MNLQDRTAMEPRTPALGSLRALVAIASYGTGNDKYLRKILAAYRAMPFAVDIVVLSNVRKSLGPGVECRVGLPNRNPWSLPFAHKKLFAERANDYDLFIYSEDDILITQRSLEAWLAVNAELIEGEVPGFLRIEFGADGEVNYPDAHAWFHWDVASLRRRGDHTLAAFTNAHAACYVLNRAQLARALATGRYDAPPHEGEYDLLCTAATDVYTHCGFEKLIPVSRLNEFTVHHMSNRYVGKMGLSGAAFARQTEALLSLAGGAAPPSLLPARSPLWGGDFAKNYYEPLNAQASAVIPASARSALSLGCGTGATEIALVERGLRVAAIPLDPVIAAGAGDRGVELIEGDLARALDALRGRRFDAVLAINVLHLLPDPVGSLARLSELLADGGAIVMQSPNMLNLPAIWRQIRDRRLETPLGFRKSGSHLASARALRSWCARAGLSCEFGEATWHPRLASYASALPALLRPSLACEVFAVARPLKAQSVARTPAVARASC